MEDEGKQENGIIKNEIQRKLRILCLHGFRTSGEILKKLISRWPESVLEKLDLMFLDAPFPAQGKSDVEGIYDPPFFEWFQADKDFKEYYNFEECLDFLEDHMLKHGPFDGVLGFSLGALLSAALPGMQREGVALAKVPDIKFLILISGSKFGGSMFGLPKLATNAFSSLVKCPSLHIIGEFDFLREEGEALLNSFVDPVVINHPKGHTVPRLVGEDLEKMLAFIQKMQLHEV
ncbi:Hypothetical predicted protein [Olea europaea subsp. europaea]|uniref:Serine hydrolase domain-containing protein n=1 Tax=Olea europaea subsp. europaea TaxID=158383 RepID=A0A8S0Q6H4_OLEEU|nr:Hypothetical predicted protein [Olea europaea subsp. europaea]